ncbi:MAG TPA: Rrf2 family transcriptional regulator [Acidimicrobiia bacterium]|nr:Rrf2 family transcriptional regulator [Acidimicrobiia bacterium]
MKISAKSDYAVRAAAELAAASGRLVKGEELARAQGIPLEFLENILRELRVAGVVIAQRGAEGGYGLARPAEEITVAEILNAVEGPLASVQRVPLEELAYHGAAERLADVWIAMRAGMHAVIGSVTLADLAAGNLPDSVRAVIPIADAPAPTPTPT